MRVLLLIVLFVVWEASAGVPPSPVPTLTGVMGFAVGYGLLIAAARAWGSRAAREGASYEQLADRVDRFHVGLAVARTAVPAWFAVGVFALGWRHAVDGLLRRALGPAAVESLVTPGAVVGLLPGLAAWAGLWWAQYPVDRAVRERGAIVQIEADLPVFLPPSLGSYLANKLRVQMLLTTVPVLMILAARDAATLALRRAGPLSDGVEAGVSVATTAAVLLVAPAVLRRVLSTRPLPEGRLRRRLDDVRRLAGVRCRELLQWDTHHNLGNAAVMGVLPAVRYVMFTDLLLQSMTDEHLQAVFAHELGHVRHRHLAWLIGVLGTGMAALSVAGEWAAGWLHPTTRGGVAAAEAALLAASTAVIWVVFGTLSRWFERQADVYAVRLIDRAAPGTGAAAMSGALHRVSVVNNVPVTARNWTHGSIAARLTFIGRLARDPATAARFDRTGRQVRAGLVVAIVVCGAVAIWAIGRG